MGLLSEEAIPLRKNNSNVSFANTGHRFFENADEAQDQPKKKPIILPFGLDESPKENNGDKQKDVCIFPGQSLLSQVSENASKSK